MISRDPVILVVDSVVKRADQLKDLLEFMDAPEVRVVGPERWREEIDGIRIAAVFLTESMGADVTRELMDAIGQRDPNIPIVIVDEERYDDDID